MANASLKTLFAKSIDYAGMFPPCSLALEPAFQNHAQYVRSSEAWMLNAFVLSIEQFDAAKQLLSLFDPAHPLRVAALGPKTANADAFLEALEDTDVAIRSLSSNVDLVSISQLEMFLPQDVDVGLLNVHGAATLAAEHRWDARQAAIMLEDESVDSFSFEKDFFSWRGWTIDIERLRYRRRFVASFGSCSFDEPHEDLRALRLL